MLDGGVDGRTSWTMTTGTASGRSTGTASGRLTGTWTPAYPCFRYPRRGQGPGPSGVVRTAGCPRSPRVTPAPRWRLASTPGAGSRPPVRWTGAPPHPPARRVGWPGSRRPSSSAAARGRRALDPYGHQMYGRQAYGVPGRHRTPGECRGVLPTRPENSGELRHRKVGAAASVHDTEAQCERHQGVHRDAAPDARRLARTAGRTSAPVTGPAAGPAAPPALDLRPRPAVGRDTRGNQVEPVTDRVHDHIGEREGCDRREPAGDAAPGAAPARGALAGVPRDGTAHGVRQGFGAVGVRIGEEAFQGFLGAPRAVGRRRVSCPLCVRGLRGPVRHRGRQKARQPAARLPVVRVLGQHIGPERRPQRLVVLLGASAGAPEPACQRVAGQLLADVQIEEALPGGALCRRDVPDERQGTAAPDREVGVVRRDLPLTAGRLPAGGLLPAVRTAPRWPGPASAAAGRSAARRSGRARIPGPPDAPACPASSRP
ncbi:hypothetical protein SRIMM317S_02888 [Streptomyces rimosus subsp. rimosus]